MALDIANYDENVSKHTQSNNSGQELDLMTSVMPMCVVFGALIDRNTPNYPIVEDVGVV